MKPQNNKYTQYSSPAIERHKESKEQAIKEFYRKAVMLQEEEKKKISRDLHDETAQIIITLGASLNILEKEIKANSSENAIRVINESRKLLKDIAARMKALAYNLRPPMLDILGLPAALREYFSQCTKSNSVKIEFSENLKDGKLNEEVEITLYRIVQEALYNITKHSMAGSVKVNLILAGKELHLRIEDDGKGFDVQEYYDKPHIDKMGLRGIKERVDILKGNFAVESMAGKGTRLLVTLPIEDDVV